MTGRVVAVVGPTATGKSDLGVELALALGGEVVNADSMQLYAGMDIGTAKLTPAERCGVPHALLDVWPVTRTATAADYQSLCRGVLDDLLAQGRTPVVVGGSGLYLRAALDDLRFPGTDAVLRARLEDELAQLGPYALHARLAALDPAAAARIEPANGRRTVRALEVLELGGPVPGELTTYRSVYGVVQVGLDRDDLAERVAQRVDRMWERGLVAEVAQLAGSGLREGVTASRALGYAQALDQLDGRLTEQQARSATVTATGGGSCAGSGPGSVATRASPGCRATVPSWTTGSRWSVRAMPGPSPEAMQVPGTGVDLWCMEGPQISSDNVSALHRSPSDGSLELLYQPEIEFATGTIVAMEALLRWHHAGAVLAPGDFLDLADTTGAGSTIGQWVLETGAAEVAHWQGLGGRRQLWLNVSSGPSRAPDFVTRVAEQVLRHELPDGALGLEFSETTLRQLGAEAAPLLTDLRAAGVALAVDDFASWYSALGAMDLLPLSAVKLGQQHVRGIDQSADDPVAAVVVRAAHERGLYVVAEGVETWAEAATLTALGCDRAHGWLFASAQRADKARWLLSQGRGWRGSAVTPTTRARQRFGALTA